MNNQRMDRMSDQEVLERILYRDALIIGFNKPSGIPVHPANKAKHNLEQYFSLLQFGLPNPPALGHRLDLGTSGCLLLARNKEAAHRLQIMFTNKLIKKTYVAVVEGLVKLDEGRIDIPLSKRSAEKKHWWMKADPMGNISAITDYQVIKRDNNKTWLRLWPLTGRTHQLRVHCQALGTPIIGDYIYGNKSSLPLHLHAEQIIVPLYPKKDPIVIEALWPAHINNFFSE
jgi:tRNA pseudouridine32 synthase/23S rRNA pseudouridine746 synthase